MANLGNGGGSAAYARSVAEANARNGLWLERSDAQTLAQLGPAPDDDEPDLRQLREIPYLDSSEFDRKPQILAVIQQLRMGQFYLAGRFGEALLRDAKIYSALQTRINGLLGLDVAHKPSQSGARAKKIAGLLADDDTRPGLWRQIVPSPELSELLRWGLLLGVGIGELSWSDEDVQGAGEIWVPHLKVWHPSSLYWQWDTQHPDGGYFRIITANGTMTVRPGDGRWVLYTPFGYRRCWLRGLMQPLADPYLDRRWAVRDFNRFNEVHGLPTRVVMVPAEAPDADKKRVARQVNNLGSEPTLQLPAVADGKPNWDYKLIEAQSREWEGFQARIKLADADVEEVVLGQQQGSDVKSGLVAAKMAASEVRADYRRMDATTIPECLREQMLRPFCLFNWGDPELASRPEYDLEPDEDEAKGAEVLASLANTIAMLATAAQQIQSLGMVPPPIVAILEAHGLPSFDTPTRAAPREALPPPTAGDALFHAEETLRADGLAVHDGERQPIRRLTFQGFPIAIENDAGTIRRWGKGANDFTPMSRPYGYIEGHTGADGEYLDCYLGDHEEAPHVYVVHQQRADDPARYDEDKLMLGFLSEQAAKVAYLAHRGDGERCFGGMSTIPLETFRRKLKTRTGGRKITATAEHQHVHLVAPRAAVKLSKAAIRRSRSYGDQLADASRDAAVDALAPDLKVVLDIIRTAKDATDLRTRLLAAFKGMSPGRLQKLVERSTIMATLEGRHEITKGIVR